MATTVKQHRTHAQAICTCGWEGQLVPTRTVEGHTLAQRDAYEHDSAHASGKGWFDFRLGWVKP